VRTHSEYATRTLAHYCMRANPQEQVRTRVRGQRCNTLAQTRLRVHASPETRLRTRIRE
jgi:hypothetical protein